MANNHTKALAKKVEESVTENIDEPRSLKIAQNGIRTNTDFAKLMSSLMSDLIEGRITPQVGNATCNAGGKLLKVVEMSYKYGIEGKPGRRTLLLTVDES